MPLPTTTCRAPHTSAPKIYCVFCKLKANPLSANDISRGLHLGKSDRRPLFKILAKLKKRNAIEELPGGRYRLARRKGGGKEERRAPSDAPRKPDASGQARFPAPGSGPRRNQRPPGPPSRWLRLRGPCDSRAATRRRPLHPPRRDRRRHARRPVVARIKPAAASPARAAPKAASSAFSAARTPASSASSAMARAATWFCPTTFASSTRSKFPPGDELTPALREKLGLPGLDRTGRTRQTLPGPPRTRRRGRQRRAHRAIPAEARRPPDASSKFSAAPATSASTSRSSSASITCRTFFLPRCSTKPKRAPCPSAKRSAPAAKIFAHLPIVTIDGETARDFDDAVYVERRADGGWHLQVHIADVAHYVRIGSAARSGSAPARHLRLFSRSRRAHASRIAFERHVLAEAPRRSPGPERADGIRRRAETCSARA